MAEQTVVEEVTQAAAEKEFLSGFDGTRQAPVPEKTETPPKADVKQGTQATEKKPVDTPPASVVPKEIQALFGQLDHRFKSLEGRVGRVLTEIDRVTKETKKTGAPAPTKDQIEDASKSLAKWGKLKEDFAEWGEAIDERFAAERAEISKLIPQIDVDGFRKEVSGVSELANASAQEARQLAVLDMKHDGWEETIKTPEFRKWSYESGPTDEEVSAYEHLRDGVRNELGQFIAPVQPARADQMFKEFGLKYPQWWASRGAFISSPHARDAVKLLDAYAKKDDGKVEETKQKNNQRLEAAVVPKGTSVPQTVGVSDEEAFLRGFAKG